MRKGWRASILLLVLLLAGCRGMPAVEENPLAVAHPQYDFIWDETVKVIEVYFDIAYENRYDGRIFTLPQSSATLFEPWIPDSGLYDRFEATLQTIRRRCFVLIQPAPTGGFTITVEVYKELENLPRPVFSTYSADSFISSIEPITESLVTSPIKPAAGWISLGRDLKLEARILNDLHEAIDAHTRL